MTKNPTPVLHLLGAPWIEHGAERPALAVRKAWAVLAVLALERRATRARLAALLWPDLDDAASRRNLRRELHRLREAGLGTLIADDGQALTLANADSDVARFLAALHSADPRAAELYGGALLDGWDVGSEAFDGWLAQQREQLHSQWQQAARARIETLQAGGDLRGALALALRVLDVDALQEADYRRAMSLHDRLGDREAALALYERCRKALGRELGLRPMAETESLAERIRRGESAPAEDRHAAATDPALLGPVPMVGRAPALAELAAACVAGSPVRLVLVSGPAGVGKTRLVREFVRESVRDGAGGHWWAAQPGDALAAYAAPARWLRERGASADTLPPMLRHELARVLPELADDGPAPDPASPPERLHDALTRAWQTLAGVAGAEVFDDLHWLDPASLRWLLSMLARRGAAQPPALLLARSEELADDAAAALRALAAAGAARTLALAPLGGEDTLALVQRLAGTASGQRFAARLHGATGGHPLFLVETLRHLLDSGWVRVGDDGAWHTPVDEQTTDYAELPVPASVREAILARAERLGEAARRLLEAAACMRRPVHFELVAGATALSEWEGVEALARIRRAHLMAEDGEGRHRFTHDLIGQTLADALTPERRRLLHRALARALEHTGNAEPAEVAAHWQDGGEPAQAAPWWARAAQQAEDLGAVDDALLAVSRAVEHTADPATQAALWLQAARLHARRAAVAPQRDALQRADRAARASGDAALMARVQLRRASAVASADPATAGAGVDEVLAQRRLPALVRSAAHQQRALLARLRGDLAGSLAESERALRALPPGQWRSRAELAYQRGIVWMLNGESERAEAELRTAEEAARAGGDDACRVRAMCVRAGVLGDRGGAAVSRAICTEALEIAGRTHDVAVQRTAQLNLLRALVALGDVKEALRVVEAAIALSPGFTNVNEEQALVEARCTIALMAGDLGIALEAAPAMLAVSRRAGETYRAVSGLVAPAEAWLLMDSRRADAAALLDEAEARLGDAHLDDMIFTIGARRAAIALLDGDPARALAILSPLLDRPAWRHQDRLHADWIHALSRHRLGEPAELAAPPEGANPEPATLMHAARLEIHGDTDGALAWFDGAAAPPLERLHLALALLRHLPAGAERNRVRAEAGTLARRLHDSLAAHPADAAAWRQQFAPLF